MSFCPATGAELEELARAVRHDVIEMIYQARMGHPGSSLSCVEILTALYLGGILRVDPEHPHWEERDRFVLSKGHASPTLYSVLSRRGFFPREKLRGFRQYGSGIPAYPEMSTPGVDMESGSLGNGLSTCVGMALSSRIKGIDNGIYCVMGDGEQQEGLVWEAAMCAAHHRLDRIIGFVDANKLQITGPVERILGIEPLEAKWESFGWRALRIDGHSFKQIFSAVETARGMFGSGIPTVIIADTVKGKGVSFMENVLAWHRGVISEEQRTQALKEIHAKVELI